MPEAAPPGETVIPLAEETATVSTGEVETGRVRVSVVTDIDRVVARETLRGRRVEVERVPVDRMLAAGEPPPGTREVGDTLVVPVVEETAVVVKRLVVREEVRLRFLPVETPFGQEVSVRRQRATVERTPIDPKEERLT